MHFLISDWECLLSGVIVQLAMWDSTAVLLSVALTTTSNGIKLSGDQGSRKAHWLAMTPSAGFLLVKSARFSGCEYSTTSTLILGPLQMCRVGNKERLYFGDLLRVFLWLYISQTLRWLSDAPLFRTDGRKTLRGFFVFDIITRITRGLSLPKIVCYHVM